MSESAQMVLTALPGIPLVEPGHDLGSLILSALERAKILMQDGDVLVVAQKVVSKAEGRLVNLADLTPSPEAIHLAQVTHKDPRLVEAILRETDQVLRAQPGVLIVQHRCGFVCANAGVDHSNVRGKGGRPEDWVLLLPEDPDRSAEDIRRRMEIETGARIGVLIIDSHGRAWRLGTIGMSIGAAGFPALLDLRGRLDLYSDPLRITQVGLADEVAAAASVLMGQAAEGLPVIHVRGLPYKLREGSMAELIRPEELDLFR